MSLDHKQDHFPVLNLQEFSGSRHGSPGFLFHELHGERVIEKPHKHDFFIIILFGQARGQHTIDFTEHRLADYQIHLVFPGQVHTWHIEAGTLGYQLMISRELFEQLFSSLRFSSVFYQRHPVLNIRQASYQALLYEFTAIGQELRRDPAFRETIALRSRLIALMTEEAAKESFKDSGIYHSHPILSRFFQLIDRFFRQEHSVTFYAAQLNITPNYLNVISRKYLKHSASSLIQNQLLLEAKRLLKASDLSVKQIAFDLNFYDQASFSKFFRSQTGMTPSRFKEQE